MYAIRSYYDSFTTAFTVDDFPVPASPYSNTLATGLLCRKARVF